MQIKKVLKSPEEFKKMFNTDINQKIYSALTDVKTKILGVKLKK